MRKDFNGKNGKYLGKQSVSVKKKFHGEKKRTGFGKARVSFFLL